MKEEIPTTLRCHKLKAFTGTVYTNKYSRKSIAVCVFVSVPAITLCRTPIQACTVPQNHNNSLYHSFICFLGSKYYYVHCDLCLGKCVQDCKIGLFEQNRYAVPFCFLIRRAWNDYLNKRNWMTLKLILYTFTFSCSLETKIITSCCMEIGPCKQN